MDPHRCCDRGRDGGRGGSLGCCCGALGGELLGMTSHIAQPGATAPADLTTSYAVLELIPASGCCHALHGRSHPRGFGDPLVRHPPGTEAHPPRGQIDVGDIEIVPMKTAESERLVALLPKLERYLGRRGVWPHAGQRMTTSSFLPRGTDPRTMATSAGRSPLRPSTRNSAVYERTIFATRSSRTCFPTATSPPISRAAGHANPHITAKLYSHALGSPEEQAHRAALAAAAAGLGH